MNKYDESEYLCVKIYDRNAWSDFTDFHIPVDDLPFRINTLEELNMCVDKIWKYSNPKLAAFLSKHIANQTPMRMLYVSSTIHNTIRLGDVLILRYYGEILIGEVVHQVYPKSNRRSFTIRINDDTRVSSTEFGLEIIKSINKIHQFISDVGRRTIQLQYQIVDMSKDNFIQTIEYDLNTKSWTLVKLEVEFKEEN